MEGFFMSTLSFITQGSSIVYHLSLDEKTALCGKEIYNATSVTQDIPKKQRPCKRCMMRVSNMIAIRQEKSRDESIDRLESYAKGRKAIAYDSENQIAVFSDFPSLSDNAMTWLLDYRKRKPDKYVDLLCIDHNRPYRATLYYKSSEKKYDILLPGRQEYYNSQQWRDLSERVFERDNHTCRLCGCTTDRFTAHHITYERFGCEDLNDLTTLCQLCHSSFHNSGRNLRR